MDDMDAMMVCDRLANLARTLDNLQTKHTTDDQHYLRVSLGFAKSEAEDIKRFIDNAY